MDIKKKFSYLLLVFVFILTALGGTAVKASAEDSTVLDQGREIIKDYYLETVPASVLNAPTLEEIVKGLNDPYSHYFTAKEYADFVDSINNSFCGIGVTMEVVPEGAKVLTVVDGAPAMKAGVLAGDIIIEADGHSLAGLSNEEIVSYVRGEAGTSVDIKVKRGQTSLEFKIVREQITLPTVSGKILNNNIGYIDLSSFGDNTGAEFASVLSGMKNVDSYIIDLRNNGGGYISTAADIAGYFIGSNPLVKLTDKAGNNYTENALSHQVISDKPIIFLVNENTASASEILSAAVKDYDKAFFIGTKTYGKGVAQGMFGLSDGSVLKLTVYKFVSPEGHEINKVGITPNLMLEDTSKDAVDPLKTAEVLLSSSQSNSNKTGVTKLVLGSKSFEISHEILQSSDYKQASDYLMNNVANADNKYLWSNGQWVKAASITAGNSTSGNTAEASSSGKAAVTSSVLTKLAASTNTSGTKVLPATGSAVDEKVLLILGGSMLAAGIMLMRKTAGKV